MSQYFDFEIMAKYKCYAIDYTVSNVRHRNQMHLNNEKWNERLHCTAFYTQNQIIKTECIREPLCISPRCVWIARVYHIASLPHMEMAWPPHFNLFVASRCMYDIEKQFSIVFHSSATTAAVAIDTLPIHFHHSGSFIEPSFQMDNVNWSITSTIM